MIYQLSLTAYFCERYLTHEITEKLQALIPRLAQVNPGTAEEEESYLDVIENHHDEHPASPCQTLLHWDNHTQKPTSTLAA